MALSTQYKSQLQRLKKTLLAFLSLGCNSELNLNLLSEFPRTTKDKPHSSSSAVNGEMHSSHASASSGRPHHYSYGIMYAQWLGWLWCKHTHHHMKMTPGCVSVPSLGNRALGLCEYCQTYDLANTSFRDNDGLEETCPQRGGFGLTASITDFPKVSETCIRSALAAALQK